MTDHDSSRAGFSGGFSSGFQTKLITGTVLHLQLPINCVLADQQPYKAASTLLTGSDLDSFPFK